jgi:drug/metabolite transporter (DMT)-like permease
LKNAAVADRRYKTMIKLLLILCVGLVFESTGVILLKKGMTQIGDMNGVTAAEIFRVVKAGATNPQILLGMFFEALFFFCLLILMAKSEISLLWPLTALSFVFATFAAMWFLGERVSSIRWIGVILIMIGAAFISYSEHAKEKPAPPPAGQSETVAK